MLWGKFITALALVPCLLAKPIAIHQHHENEIVSRSDLQRRAAGGGTYTIGSSDSGNSIAAIYSITFSTLKSANPSVNWNRLYVGQKINMPSTRLPSTYTVVSGDSQTSIAKKYNVYTDDLASANPNVNWNRLQSGTQLRIPGYGSYTTYAVTSGDYGYAIASAFGISFNTLSAANPGVNWNSLQIGQVLTVPAGTSPSRGTIPSSAAPPKSSTTTTIKTTSSTTTSKSTTSVTTTSSSSSTKTSSSTTTSTSKSQSTSSTTTSFSSGTTSKSASTSVQSSSTTSSTATSSVTSSKSSSTASSSSSGGLTSSTILSSSTVTSSGTSARSSTSTTTTSRSTTTSTTSTSSTTAVATGEPTVTPTAVVTGANYVKGGNNNDGVSSRADTYTFYKGDGSSAAGWPAKSQWISFATMWKNFSPYLGQSCNSLYGVANNSPQENQYIYNAIQAVSTNSGVDHRLILATIIQESSGCVRVRTTTSPDGTVTNPGLMQDFNGSGSCNRNGVILNPCPASQIYQMISDGTFGTSTDGGNTYYAGLVQDINSSPNHSDAQVIYRASRIYNSGSVPSSNDLGDPGATRCYVSDVANLLMGWVGAKKTCTLDG